MEGFGWTRGMQGGIGYPPLVVKHRGRWRLVQDSHNHGGTHCRLCDGPCLRALVVRPERWIADIMHSIPNLNRLPQIPWSEFAIAISPLA